MDKLKLTDSVSEQASNKSIVNATNDVFVEVLEKISAVFNMNGFAIFIKIQGIIMIKNYIPYRINMRVQLNDEFNL